jgi:hypothetical protein
MGRYSAFLTALASPGAKANPNAQMTLLPDLSDVADIGAGFGLWQVHHWLQSNMGLSASCVSTHDCWCPRFLVRAVFLLAHIAPSTFTLHPSLLPQADIWDADPLRSLFCSFPPPVSFIQQQTVLKSWAQEGRHGRPLYDVVGPTNQMQSAECDQNCFWNIRKLNATSQVGEGGQGLAHGC